MNRHLYAFSLAWCNARKRVAQSFALMSGYIYALALWWLHMRLLFAEWHVGVACHFAAMTGNPKWRDERDLAIKGRNNLQRLLDVESVQ